MRVKAAAVAFEVALDVNLRARLHALLPGVQGRVRGGGRRAVRQQHGHTHQLCARGVAALPTKASAVT